MRMSFSRASILLLATLLVVAQCFAPNVEASLHRVEVAGSGKPSVDAKQSGDSTTPSSSSKQTAGTTDDECECRGCRNSEYRRSPWGINDVLQWVTSPAVRPRSMVPELDALLDTAPLFHSWPTSFLDNRVFDASSSAPVSSNVAIRTLSSDDKNVVLGVRLPGVPRENLKISVDAEGLLTVEGGYSEHTHVAAEEQNTLGEETKHQYQFFAQRQLPYGVDASQVSADYKDGLLRITVPKPNKETVTRVSIA